ncbi:MAG: N-acetylneuraminate synthase [Saprospiraceae bacterium]|nr:N-acetylneuraminate synthase [Saprospiraceae bacterium]
MPEPIHLIAEVGQAHDGSLGILHSYIDAVAKTGVKIIKFQVHIAEAESSPQEPFRVNFSYEDASRFDYWNRMSFPQSHWAEIKAHCDEAGLEFMASTFSLAAVDMMESIDILRYKVGSGEINNYLMLEKIARTGKPILLSSGMSTFLELDRALEFLKPFGNEIAILQCTTSYPTSPENIGLNVIPQMMDRYPGHQIGFSDHSGKIYPCLAAVAMGASILEFHVVFDRQMFGPDSSSSLNLNEVSELVTAVKYIKTALDHPVDKNNNEGYATLKGIFEKSLAVNKDLAAGHELTLDDLESKKPAGMGIPAENFAEVIGKKLKANKKAYEFLGRSDLW